MLDSEAAAIIAGASAIGGGVVVAVSNYVVSRAQARDARRAELQHALIELLDVLSLVTQRLRLEPEAGKAAQTINETIAARLPQLDHAVGLLRRRLLDPKLDGLSSAISKALSRATVIAPLTLLPALGRLAELMEQADERDDSWWAQWEAARTDYTLMCREVVGSGVAPGARERLRQDASR